MSFLRMLSSSLSYTQFSMHLLPTRVNPSSRTPPLCKIKPLTSTALHLSTHDCLFGHVQLRHHLPGIENASLRRCARPLLNELEVAYIAPVVDVLFCVSKTPLKIQLWTTTYKATQILAPTTRFPINIEIIQQQNEHDEHENQAASSDEPPSPPCASSALKEPNWTFDEAYCPPTTFIRGDFVWRGTFKRRLVFISLIYTFSKGIRRVQDADPEDETHKETSDMGEVV